MKKSIRKSLSLFLSLIAVCVFGVFMFGLTPASAENVETFLMSEGAEIRSEEPEGLRFTTFVNDEWVKDNPNVEFGTIIVPTHVYTGELSDLTVETENIEIVSRTKWREVNTYTAFSVVLTEIPESFYGTDIIAKSFAYDTVGQTYTYVSNPQVRSIATVAANALFAGETDEIYTTIIDKAVSEINLNLESKTVLVGESVSLSVDKEYKCVWSSSNTDVATVSDNGFVNAIAEGEATITAKLGSRTDTFTLTVEGFDTLYISAKTSGDYSFDVEGTVQSVSYGGVALNADAFSQEGNTLSIAKGALYNATTINTNHAKCTDNNTKQCIHSTALKDLVVTTDGGVISNKLEIVTETIDFEDGRVPSAIKLDSDKATMQIISGGAVTCNRSHVDGTYSLQISVPANTSKVKLTVAKEYFDMIFDISAWGGSNGEQFKFMNSFSLDGVDFKLDEAYFDCSGFTGGNSGAGGNNTYIDAKPTSYSDITFTLAGKKILTSGGTVNIDLFHFQSNWGVIGCGDNPNTVAVANKFETLFIGAKTEGNYTMDVEGTVQSVSYGGVALSADSYNQEGNTLSIVKGALYNATPLNTSHTAKVSNNIHVSTRKDLVVTTDSGEISNKLEIITETIDFEDGYVPSVIVVNSNPGFSYEVSETAVGIDHYSHVDGLKGLKISIPANSSYLTVTIKKEFLALVFANSNAEQLILSTTLNIPLSGVYLLTNNGSESTNLTNKSRVPKTTTKDIVLTLSRSDWTSACEMYIDCIAGIDSAWRLVGNGNYVSPYDNLINFYYGSDLSSGIVSSNATTKEWTKDSSAYYVRVQATGEYLIKIDSEFFNTAKALGYKNIVANYGENKKDQSTKFYPVFYDASENTTTAITTGNFEPFSNTSGWTGKKEQSFSIENIVLDEGDYIAFKCEPTSSGTVNSDIWLSVIKFAK